MADSEKVRYCQSSNFHDVFQMAQVFEERAKAFASETSGDEIALEFDQIYDREGSPWGVAAYRFHILFQGERAGTISLRVGSDERLVQYAGQIGFGVAPPFRGHRLAELATRLLLPLAREHGLAALWITCNPANTASLRTLERLGAVYVETVPLPEDYDSYAQGEREKCRFRLDVT
jgi:predicted acetyltransferase